MGEKTSASTGRWVLRNRRWVWASTAGSLISFGGTRRSIQGDISPTSRSSGPLEQQLSQDLLDPGGAGLRIGGDDDVVIAEQEIVPDRRVEVVIVEFARLDRRTDEALDHDQHSLGGAAPDGAKGRKVTQEKCPETRIRRPAKAKSPRLGASRHAVICKACASDSGKARETLQARSEGTEIFHAT